ncbi:hypothetical protein [Micromonospora sp. NPDC005113]
MTNAAAAAASSERRFAAYEPYVNSLRDLAGRTLTRDSSADEVEAALDGAASRALTKLVGRPARREVGAYFTSGLWKARLLELLPNDLSGAWLDPACGAGDLLICVARRLPIRRTLAATLSDWASLLHGVDLHPQFVEATKLRLLALAASRHIACHPTSKPSTINFNTLFPNIRVGDGLTALRKAPPDVTGIIMNPPFTTQTAPRDMEWGSGKVTMAGMFLDAAVSLNHGKRIVALLPDVIRTGSRYASLRRKVGKQLSSAMVGDAGEFGPDADVDVFVLAGIAAAQPSNESLNWWPKPVATAATLSTFVKVSVGTVVDNRDLHEGPWYPYLTARELGRKAAMEVPERRRRSTRPPEIPPFVVLRRTSRPANGGRALDPVVVLGKVPVLVDNHLIILRPHFNSLDACHLLAEKLKSTEIASWLEGRIRLRHLTTQAVGEIPIDLRNPNKAAEAAHPG